ncbi:hypothetical protein, partial [Vreelandella populi]|uniref:hypothetical protein n=1 Tax=Vreelandella populi TaxID=2498858 RepID=UPI001C8D82DB
MNEGENLRIIKRLDVLDVARFTSKTTPLTITGKCVECAFLAEASGSGHRVEGFKPLAKPLFNN